MMKNILTNGLRGGAILTNKNLPFIIALSAIALGSEAYDTNDHMNYVGLKLINGKLFYSKPNTVFRMKNGELKKEFELTTRGDEHGNNKVNLKDSFDRCAKLIQMAWNNRTRKFTDFVDRKYLDKNLTPAMQNGLVLLYCAWAHLKYQTSLTKENVIRKLVEECAKKFEFKVTDQLINDIKWYLTDKQWNAAFWIKAVKFDKNLNKTKDIEKLKERINANKGDLDAYSAMIVSKYFATVKDFKNLEMVAEKFQGNMQKFLYNPVPLTSMKERDLFPNIQTYHIYGGKGEALLDKIKYDDDIKIVKNHNFYSYSDFEKLDRPVTYSPVIFTRTDVEKKFLKSQQDLTAIIAYLKDIQPEIAKGNNAAIDYDILQKYADEIGIIVTLKVIRSDLIKTIEYLKDEGKADRQIIRRIYQDALIGLSNDIITKEVYDAATHLSDGSEDFLDKPLIELEFAVTTKGKITLSNKNIILPMSISAVGPACFLFTDLASISIPQRVKRIYPYAFWGCPDLKEITLYNTDIIIDNNALSSCDNLKTIYIPDNSDKIAFKNYLLGITELNVADKITNERKAMYYKDWKAQKAAYKLLDENGVNEIADIDIADHYSYYKLMSNVQIKKISEKN